jgi:hypothetical protein
LSLTAIVAVLSLFTQPEAGDYSYSGMHDSGPLVPPIEGGPIANLIASVLQAKEHNDAYLTQIIEDEKEKAASASNSPQTKRAKTEIDS